MLLSAAGSSSRKRTHPDDGGTKLLRRVENRPTAQRNVFSSAADCSLERRVTNDVTSPVFGQFVNSVTWHRVLATACGVTSVCGVERSAVSVAARIVAVQCNRLGLLDPADGPTGCTDTSLAAIHAA